MTQPAGGERFRTDALGDSTTGRGMTNDYVQTQKPVQRGIEYTTAMEWYRAVGLVRNIIDCVPKDAVREWFEIEGLDKVTAKKVQDRMEQLGVRQKLVELIRASRLSNRGSFLYYGVLADLPQTDLDQPLPASIHKLEYLNVIPNGQDVGISYQNSSDPTRADYGIPEFQVSGSGKVHPSRLSWVVDSWDIKAVRGVSLLEVIVDGIVASDAAVWSVTQILKELSISTFKSKTAVDMNPSKIQEFLTHLKRYTDSTSRLLLGPEEEYTRQIASVGGIKEMTDFVFDNLFALGRVPKSVAMGKAHGIMTAQEADQMNYYADVSRYQEIELRPILDKIIRLILAETKGINNPQSFEIKFNPLWKMDPQLQSTVEKTNSERDSMDIDSGKISPQEARQLDPRLKNLPALSLPAAVSNYETTGFFS